MDGEALTPANLDWLAALPAGPVAVDDIVEIRHGAPFDETRTSSTTWTSAARLRLPFVRCALRHTHVPAAFRMAGEMHAVGPPRGDRFRLALDNDARYLVNCGAVGQPRDGDPRAAFALLDTGARTLTIVRVPTTSRGLRNGSSPPGCPRCSRTASLSDADDATPRCRDTEDQNVLLGLGVLAGRSKRHGRLLLPAAARRMHRRAR